MFFLEVFEINWEIFTILEDEKFLYICWYYALLNEIVLGDPSAFNVEFIRILAYLHNV